MAWRLRHKDWVAGKGSKNKSAFRRIVTSGKKPGILGYLGDEAVAWCALAPRDEYVYLVNSRILKPVDDTPVWAVSCLFVKKTHRRKRLSVGMLRAAAEFAAKQGAKVVEGYPVEPTMASTPDPFLWTGVPTAFRAAGFKEVLRRSRTRPIMRYECGSRPCRPRRSQAILLTDR